MVECRYCDQEMTLGVGCTAYPGRIPADENCHDCAAPAGTLHHPGCDDEQCDHGNQAIGDCPECEDYERDYWERVSTRED